MGKKKGFDSRVVAFLDGRIIGCSQSGPSRGNLEERLKVMSREAEDRRTGMHTYVGYWDRIRRKNMIMLWMMGSRRVDVCKRGRVIRECEHGS